MEFLRRAIWNRITTGASKVNEDEFELFHGLACDCTGVIAQDVLDRFTNQCATCAHPPAYGVILQSGASGPIDPIVFGADSTCCGSNAYLLRGAGNSCIWSISTDCTMNKNAQIVGVTSGAGGTFFVPGDWTSNVVGAPNTDVTTLKVILSTGNDGNYVTASSAYNSTTDQTAVVVTGTIPDSTADGFIDATRAGLNLQYILDLSVGLNRGQVTLKYIRSYKDDVQVTVVYTNMKTFNCACRTTFAMNCDELPDDCDLACVACVANTITSLVSAFQCCGEEFNRLADVPLYFDLTFTGPVIFRTIPQDYVFHDGSLLSLTFFRAFPGGVLWTTSYPLPSDPTKTVEVTMSMCDPDAGGPLGGGDITFAILGLFVGSFSVVKYETGEVGGSYGSCGSVNVFANNGDNTIITATPILP